MKPGTWCLPALVVLAATMGCGHAGRGRAVDADCAVFRQGAALDVKGAAALRERLKEKPEDAEARLMMAGYCAGRRGGAPDCLADFAGSILWLIKERPESCVHAAAPVRGPVDGPQTYGKAQELWVANEARDGPNKAEWLGNAGRFWRENGEVASAERCLFQAINTEQDSPVWRTELGLLYLEPAISRYVSDPRVIRKRAEEEFERALVRARRPEQRLGALAGMARLSLAAGDKDKAGKRARELLAEAGRSGGAPERPDAETTGNQMLGRFALERGDVAEARACLLKSAPLPGSPRFAAFGPDFTLARGLLEKGETETVLRYLELVGRSWVWPELLERWKSEIRETGASSLLPDQPARK